MKLAMVHPRLDRRGGAENLLKWLCEGLRDRGHAVSIVTRRFKAGAWEPEDWRDIPITTIESRADRLIGRKLRAWRLARATEAAIAGCEVAVAHNFPATVWLTQARRGPARRLWFCHEPFQRLHWRTTMPTIAAAAEADAGWPWARGVFSAFAAELAGKRAREARIDEPADRAAAAAVDAILTNSAFTASRVEAVYGRPASPCLLGVPRPPEVAPLDAEPYILWVSSPLTYKNAVGGLEALRLALGAEPTLRARVVGLGDARFRGWAEELGIAGPVQLEGRVSYAELQARLAGARLVFYPTIDEPFGLVPLEAMAHGRAVVASQVGGPPETVVPGETGLLADPLDPQALADAILSLWRDPERAARMGEAGRARYDASFTMAAFLDRFEALALR